MPLLGVCDHNFTSLIRGFGGTTAISSTPAGQVVLVNREKILSVKLALEEMAKEEDVGKLVKIHFRPDGQVSGFDQ